MKREELYQIVKSNSLEEKVKHLFGRVYSSVPSKELELFLSEHGYLNQSNTESQNSNVPEENAKRDVIVEKDCTPKNEDKYSLENIQNELLNKEVTSRIDKSKELVKEIKWYRHFVKVKERFNNILGRPRNLVLTTDCRKNLTILNNEYNFYWSGPSGKKIDIYDYLEGEYGKIMLKIFTEAIQEKINSNSAELVEKEEELSKI